MKSLLVSVLFIVLALNIKAQLVIDKSFKIDETQESVRKFITHNKFDFALVSWTVSNWVKTHYYFQGLVKQGGKWYLIKISSPKISIINSYKLIDNSKKLSKKELNLIRKDLKIDSTFIYSQDEISSLPDICQYIKNGKQRGLLSVSDGGKWCLVKYEKNKFTSLSSYAPNTYLQNCYPYVPEFGKLKGLVNTSVGFWKVFKDFNLE